MTFEGRQLLYRVGIYCSREWGDALARYRASMNVMYLTSDPTAPFEIDAWHDALEIVDDLRSGRQVREKYRK